MEPVPESTGTAIKHQYRTTSGYQMEDRKLLLQGGKYDGRTWVGVVKVGQRVFCGDGDWATDGVYTVTDAVENDADGNPVSIAVPAFAVED